MLAKHSCSRLCAVARCVGFLCIAYFKTRWSSTNCLDALTAYSLYMPDLSRDHIYLFISDNFDAVFKQQKFKNLTTNDLITLLGKLNKSKVNQ